MKFIISGKNIEVTPGLKDAIEQKLGKLERYFTPETEINVTLSVEKGRQKIEVTIPVKGNIIRSEQTSNDMYVSIDLVEEIIERQLRKYKNKLVARNQGHPTSYASSGNSFRKEFFDSEEETTEDDEVRIVRTKKFGIKPMFPEDACVQIRLQREHVVDSVAVILYVDLSIFIEESGVRYRYDAGFFDSGEKLFVDDAAVLDPVSARTRVLSHRTLDRRQYHVYGSVADSMR